MKINVAHLERKSSPDTFQEIRGHELIHIDQGMIAFIWRPNSDTQETLMIPIHDIRSVITTVEDLK